MRIVQQGSGSPRPAVIVYHLSASNDAAVIAACPPNALIANDTGPTNTGYYNNVPALATTLAALSQQFSCQLSPVVLAGFSEGGLVTKHLLDLGADPDVLIIADGTYGADFTSWKKFADKAKAGTKTMLASYSLGTLTPRSGLRSVTGFPLTQPGETTEGKLTVFGFGDGNHGYQGAVELPKMLSLAFGGPKIAPSESSVLPKLLLVLAASGVAAWYLRKVRIFREA